MDLNPIFDGVAAVLASNPKTATVVVSLAVVPYVATIGERLTRRKHSTWINTFFGALARWPGPRPR